jgi:hypothetical protein
MKYQLSCQVCQAIYSELIKTDFKTISLIACQAASLAQKKKDLGAKAWKIIFDYGIENDLLSFLIKHGDLNKADHQIIITVVEGNQKGKVYNCIGYEICQECGDTLDTIWYDPPFPSCQEKHLAWTQEKAEAAIKNLDLE